MFRGGDGVAERRVHHDDTPARCGRDVHIVHADTGTTDNPEIVCCLNDFFRHLGGRANGQSVIIFDDSKQRFLVLSQVRLKINVHAVLAEYVDRGFGKLV